MFCEKRSHPLRWVMLAGAVVLVAGVAAFCMGGSKKGRRLTRKARRIGRQVEGLVRDELGNLRA